MNSRAAGTIPDATIADVTCAAWSTLVKSARSVRTDCGFGVRHGDVDRQTKTPLRSDEGTAQVVAIALTNPVSQLDDLTAWQDDRQRQNMVEGDAVLEAVWPARILRDVSADCARRFARRIGRVEQSMRRHITVQPKIDDSWLDGRAAVLDIQGDDFLETVETDHDDVITERTTREPCARTARYERKILLGEKSNDGDRFVAGAGKDG